MSSDVGRPAQRVLLGVCGGIAAFKSVLLIRRLQDAGFEVRVVMTESATRFVGEATLHAISGHPVYRRLWDFQQSSGGELHVELGAWADAMVIYPATANFVGGVAAGLADDLLKLSVLCFDGPVLLCPAMHTKMATHPLHSSALERLRESGLHVLPCESGRLASGEDGPGRLAEPEVAVEAVLSMLSVADLAGRRLVISAGPTQEAIDPVRYVTNHSSGRMGYALARIALRRGAAVTLVSGPTALDAPKGGDLVSVVSAAEMQAAVSDALPGADALVMAAAVADFRPTNPAAEKRKKGGIGMERIELERTNDILGSLSAEARPPVVVGFAMETKDLVANARRKVEDKGLDLIVANDLRESGAGFQVDTNVVTILGADGSCEKLPIMSKDEVAGAVLDRLASLLPALLLTVALLFSMGCGGDDDDDGIPDWPVLADGVLWAGAAGGTLDLPVGVPLGGYTDRDRALGNEPGPDARGSDYRTDFVPSAGWQTRIPADVLWLENGVETAVLMRFGLIYSFDGLTEAVGAKLSERIGRDLGDSVFTMASHSHSSYGPFTKAFILFFGGDFFNEEIFDRLVNQLADLAYEAWESRQEAAIGLGIDPQFDPIGVDRVFHDRRGENDDLSGPDGLPTGPGYKDEQASMLRVDGVDGSPIAALYSFGIHGTILGGSNALISAEAPDHISILLNERIGGPRWMFAQGAGGDVAPSGDFNGFARLESVAENAVQGLVALYESIEVQAGALAMEPVHRYVEQGRDIRVTRNGSVDFHYLPWDPSWAEDPYQPDMRVWDDSGGVLSPLDEFWSQHGALLCGEPDIDISLFGLDVDLPMYKSCLDVEKSYSLFRIAFRSFIEDRDDYPLPLPESRTSLLGALGLRSIPVTVTGQGTELEDVVLAFAPGEVTTLWAQGLRHRAATEKGVPRTVVLGYAMDHEGYLLTVEDWLHAGYEPAITWWGPLQGEHLLERHLDVVQLAHTELDEDPSWPDFPTSTWYPEWQRAPVVPDATPGAGVSLDTLPEYLFTRDGVLAEQVQPVAQVERVSGIARFTFEGGDPAMGLVSVTIEHEQADGSWQTLQTPAGHPISDALPDLVVTYTPDPLSGTDVEPDPIRRHYYHVEWQALRTWEGLSEVAALPLGQYRFSIRGLSRDPQDSTYPYEGQPFEQYSEPFEVVPAALQVGGSIEGDVVSLQAAYPPALRGYRLVHLSSGPNTSTPLVPAGAGLTVMAQPEDNSVAPVSVGITDAEDTSENTSLRLDLSGLDTAPGQSWRFIVDDGAGNSASLSLVIP
jgi:phosphopantothenoylcysteine decarboxylase/phosphopantothenate--cysteine ligase